MLHREEMIQTSRLSWRNWRNNIKLDTAAAGQASTAVSFDEST
jgi:hypothetical protein